MAAAVPDACPPSERVPYRTVSRALADTTRLAAIVAGVLRPGDVVLLVGDLGTGKTAFTKALAATLGVGEPVTSPTFTIVREHATPARWTLVHIDAYRLEGPDDLADTGIDERLEEGAVVVIEWGDIVAAAVGPDHLDLHFTWRPGGPDEAGPDGAGPDPDECAGGIREIVAIPHGTSWSGRVGDESC